MSIWLAILLIVLLAVSGAPLFALIAAVSYLALRAAEIDSAVLAVEFYRLADMPVLVAIPLFTLAGYLLGESKAPQRLVRLTEALLGPLHGGLAIVAVLACALFTAFTGASGLTIVAIGALLYPALLHAQYPERFALGLITTSGSLGLLFAPSVPLILYGIVAQQLGTDPPVNIDDLFLAGILPGLLMICALSAYGMAMAPAKRPDRPWNRREVLAALWDARYELPLPIFVLGGVYGGIFAASEAAAVTAVYVLVVTVMIRREIALTALPRLLREAAMLVGAILLILGVSLGLTYVMIDAGVPERLFRWVSSNIHDEWTFLLVLNGFLLVVGMLLDVFSAIVILVPILVPVALSYGIHPIHLGIVFLANMQIGYFTPPVGMNLFIASYRFNTPLTTLTRASIPFFWILLGCVLLITYWPALSLALID